MTADDISFDDLAAPRAMTACDTVEATPPEIASGEIFDLSDLGVNEVGTFDSFGYPVNWVVDNVPAKMMNYYSVFMTTQPVLSCEAGPDFRVLVRGVFSRRLTNERRAAMGLSDLK